MFSWLSTPPLSPHSRPPVPPSHARLHRWCCVALGSPGKGALEHPHLLLVEMLWGWALQGVGTGDRHSGGAPGLGTAGKLWAWALRRRSEGDFGVGHSRETLGLGPAKLWGWALQADFGVQRHSSWGLSWGALGLIGHSRGLWTHSGKWGHFGVGRFRDERGGDRARRSVEFKISTPHRGVCEKTHNFPAA